MSKILSSDVEGHIKVIQNIVDKFPEQLEDDDVKLLIRSGVFLLGDVIQSLHRIAEVAEHFGLKDAKK